MVALSDLPPNTRVPHMVLLVETHIIHHCVVQPLMSSNSHHRGLIKMAHYISIIHLMDTTHIASVPLGIC